MNQTPEIAALATALVEARKEFKPAIKDSENPAFRSKYVGLDTAVEATDSALAKHGLTILQMPQANLMDQSVTITTRLLHKTGQWIEGDLTLPVKGQRGFDAQAVGSAITYGSRYALMAMLGISTVDDDGNGAVGGPDPKQMPMDKDVHDAHLDLMDNAKSMKELEVFFKNAIADARKAKDKVAEQEFTVTKDMVKKTLEQGVPA